MTSTLNASTADINTTPNEAFRQAMRMQRTDQASSYVAMIEATCDVPVEISFLEEVSDEDISLLIDMAVNPNLLNPFAEAVARMRASPPDSRYARLQKIVNDHPGARAAVLLFVDRHGLTALYQALEERGRTCFRDKWFSFDLGL